MIAIIDNYDSFTYNLVQYVRELVADEEVRVVRNDAFRAEEVLTWRPRAIILSPGPSVPESAGICIDLVRHAVSVPLFGVCLGHQAMVVAYGGQEIFAGLPDPFTATRYHSLIARRETLPHDLAVSAWTDDGLVMAVQHRGRPHFGVQFHPESYLTRGGKRILGNFLALAGHAGEH